MSRQELVQGDDEAFQHALQRDRDMGSRPRALRELKELERKGLAGLQAPLTREPNLYHALGLRSHRESTHSRTLAWLLDPSEWHGLGAGFLRGFLVCCLSRAEGPLPFSFTELEAAIHSMKVIRELHADGRIDLLLDLSPHLILGIENKIEAKEHTSQDGTPQLLRYGAALRAQLPNISVLLVYLTPEGDPPGSSALPGRTADELPVLASYREDIVPALEEALRRAEPPSTDRARLGRLVVEDYRRILMREVLGMDEEIRALCHMLWEAYPEALRELMLHQPSAYTALAGALVEAGWATSIRRKRAQGRETLCVYRPAWKEKLGETSLSGSILAGSARVPALYARVTLQSAGGKESTQLEIKLQLTKDIVTSLDREQLRQVVLGAVEDKSRREVGDVPSARKGKRLVIWEEKLGPLSPRGLAKRISEKLEPLSHGLKGL
jgi:hypothetical protein